MPRIIKIFVRYLFNAVFFFFFSCGYAAFFLLEKSPFCVLSRQMLIIDMHE
ncbi:hypothetical protein RIR_e45205_A0A2N1MSV5_9GLOM [Rhizophagus irregularis DAOM 181602=DAOM 197198]|nr:hypothetical protein RIR_e45205_A0A2N1MSV5_9GLOM [Rhizophagus irregularis DAOM 181602=DAOM 197198]